MSGARARIQAVSEITARVVDMSAHAASVVVLVMLFGIFTNTVLRYFFGGSWPFVEEYTGYGVAFLAFIPLAYTLKQGGHISIDFLVARLSQDRRAYLAIATTFLSILVVWTMFYYGLQMCLTSLESGADSHSVMQTPLWIPHAIVPAGTFLFGVEMIRQFAHLLLNLTTSRQLSGPASSPVSARERTGDG